MGIIAQELPPIQNFYPKDYGGENQNWDVSQSSEKLIYVANSEGLLEYNGADWKLYPSPNETILRSVNVVGERVYTGCFMDFGYWTKNNYGGLEYTSLSKQTGTELIQDEELWKIVEIQQYIVFQSLKRIYIYDTLTSTVNVLDSTNIITNIFKAGRTIYFQRMEEGIFTIEGGKDVLLYDNDIVKNDEVVQIFDIDSGLLLLTKHHGLYQIEENGLVPFNETTNQLLAKFSLYDGLQLSDGSYMLGTISSGLVHLDANGNLIDQIDQNSGLINNTVLSLFEDMDKNIWLGLDNGIAFMNLDSPYRVFSDTNGVLGSVYASAIIDGRLYLGTNQGLYQKSIETQTNFQLVPGTQGQVWYLKVIGETLFCGHHNGTFEVSANSIKRITNIQGTWGFSELPNHPNLLLQGSYDGLYVLEKQKSSWRLRNKIKGFDYSSRYFEVMDNQIFVNHEYNGIFKILVDSLYSEAKSVIIDTTIKGSNSGIIKYNSDLVYAYKKGVLKYDSKHDKFIKDDRLSELYSEDQYESGKLVVGAENNKLWLFNKSNITVVSSSDLVNTYKIDRIPLNKENREGILGYENVTDLGDNNYLLGKTSGYIVINTNDIEQEDFEIKLENALNSSSNKEKRPFDLKLKKSFKSTNNDFDFSFYVPQYKKLVRTEYQYRLQGLYDEWSDWSTKSETFFENLPHGEYVFQARAKIGNTLSNNIASYQFTIEKPWYISTSMIMMYALVVIAFSIFMHNVYKRHYKKQQEKLIEKNRKELQLAQVQSEKEIIKIKNDQLQIENKNKGKELAASTMNIIKKNELLTAIKSELNIIQDRDAVLPVIEIIDKNLKQGDDWELFKEAFNNADSDFFKKIKFQHPSLTPNDLKLCAYLRLNLSSKEIAQLLHISPRSVEIKRYRLRKKLHLEHEQNLVDYILAL